jgi:hypothetical protein
MTDIFVATSSAKTLLAAIDAYAKMVRRLTLRVNVNNKAYARKIMADVHSKCASGEVRNNFFMRKISLNICKHPCSSLLFWVVR